MAEAAADLGAWLGLSGLEADCRPPWRVAAGERAMSAEPRGVDGRQRGAEALHSAGRGRAVRPDPTVSSQETPVAAAPAQTRAVR